MSKMNALFRDKSDFMESLKQLAEDEGLDFEELAENFESQLETMKNRAQAKVRKLASDLDDKAHNNPWLLVGLAALVGFAASYLFSRKG